MPNIIKFAPTLNYFNAVENCNETYLAQFPSGLPNSGLKEVVCLCKFGRNLADITSFLYMVQMIIARCSSHDWAAQYFLSYVAGIMMEQTNAEATWSAVVNALGALDNLTKNEFKTAIQEYVPGQLGQSSL